MALVDQEIGRYRRLWPPNRRAATLRFPLTLEQRFESDTCTMRLREVRLTAFLAIMFYYLTAITDLVLVPDVGWTAFAYRILALPRSLGVLVRTVSGWIRESIVTASVIVAVLILGRIPAMSTAPFAPYAFGAALLGLIYANVTYPLRFSYACTFTAICVSDIAVQLGRNGNIDAGLRWALLLQVAIGGSFSLISAYRMERGTRLTYLLAIREKLRLEAVAADREAFAKLSSTDALTEIANRGHFYRQGATRLAEACRTGRSVALLMLDVDHFKRYNDFYGHQAGDTCLWKVARTITDGLRDGNDLAARYGGEEFAILLSDVTEAEVAILAQRICGSIAALGIAHANREDDLDVVTVSIGSTTRTTCDAATSMDVLVEAADRALYAAKHAGRNRFESGIALAA